MQWKITKNIKIAINADIFIINSLVKRTYTLPKSYHCKSQNYEMINK